jgi:hypothetical protein
MEVLNRTGDYVYDGKYIIPPISIARKSWDFLDEYGSTAKAHPNQYVKEMFKKMSRHFKKFRTPLIGFFDRLIVRQSG